MCNRTFVFATIKDIGYIAIHLPFYLVFLCHAVIDAHFVAHQCLKSSIFCVRNFIACHCNRLFIYICMYVCKCYCVCGTRVCWICVHVVFSAICTIPSTCGSNNWYLAWKLSDFGSDGSRSWQRCTNIDATTGWALGVVEKVCCCGVACINKELWHKSKFFVA